MNDTDPTSGSTGYQPVPSGNLPDGTGQASPLQTGADAQAKATPVSVGRLPTEAGRLPAPPLPPPRIPDHELIRPVGRGAYGEVWIARSVTGAFRAVKIVRRSSFDHERPFEREFEGILKFEPVSRTHDSQVDILHVGRGEDYFYYVMELADDQATGGQINPDNYHPRTLKSDLLFRSRLPFEECVSVGIALTTALEHLHQHGLVHRDVKPSNIIFVNGVAKLADIGLVTGVDTTRSYVGTEGFAAPEGPGTAQGDIFSLGKVLYEMSTGKDRQEFPELPTNLRELPEREGLVELNAVIARACRHDPADRYASAGAMRADLELLQSGKSLARLHRVEKQLRVLRRTGAAVAVLAVLILAGWFYQVHQTRIVREMANANSSLAKEKSKLAEEKTTLAEENRERVVRLDVANGIRLMDAEDMSAGLLWFAEALPLVTNKPAEESIHRIRIQQVIEQTPRLLLLVADDDSVMASGFSPDGNQIVIGSLQGRLRVLDSWSGRLLLERTNVGAPISQIRFSRDGKRLLLSSSPLQGLVRLSQLSGAGFAAVFDAQTGTPVFHTKNLGPEISSNIVFSAFSADGRWLAVARTDNNIRVLDAHDGHLVTRLEGHTDLIRMLMFNPEGTLLASASKDRTARVWRIPSGEPVGSAIQHTAPVGRAVFNPDGKRLATATDPITSGVETPLIIQVWDIQSGLATGQPIQGTNVTYALAFDERSGKSLLASGIVNGAKTTGIWDADTHEPRFTTRFGRSVRSWAFSPDGSSVAIGFENGGLTCIWSLASGDLLFPPFRASGWVESVHFSPDGSRLLTTSDDGTAKVWSLRQQAEAALLSLSANHSGGPSYEQAPRGRTPGPIPVGLADDALHLIDPDTLTDLGVLPAQEAHTNGLDYTAGHSGRCWTVSERFADASPTDTVALWLTKDRVWRRYALSHPSNVVHLAFNADDSRLYTSCKDLNVRVWRTSDGGLERSIAMPPSSWSIRPSLVPEAFRADCSALLLGYGSGTNCCGYLQLFDLATAELTGKPFAFSKLWGVNRMRLSPDGTRLAAVGDDQSGTIINLQTGELAAPKFKHGGSLTDLDWSPDGKRLITAGLSPEIKLWDAATGEMLLSPMFLSGGVMAARWSANGRFIVGRSEGGFVRVWDATTTEPVTPLLRHSGYIQWVCITPGNRLITASDPNLLRSWELKATALTPDVIADYARLLAGRRLGPGGTLLPIKSAELAQLFRSLRAKSPQLFESER